MHTFEVWAPDARRVELEIEDRMEPMEAVPGGWWRTAVADAGPGTRYRYSLDGGPPRPDPRSMHQPEGVDGPSAVVDHAAFEWRDRGWRGLTLPGAVLYELHVGTFSQAGTFDGVIEHLPHLVELGIDAIELLPVAEFAGDRGWGYDGVDLFAPHHAYGGPDGLKRLIDACHETGIGVVMDVVYNHLGPAGSYLHEFGPYLTDRHQTAWGDAVNFDAPGSVEVRRFVIDNALMWLRDYRCDGLRLDAVHAIVDESTLDILEELNLAVETLAAHVQRPLFVIAESDRNDPRIVRSVEAGGFGLDAAWADGWHHALHTALTGETTGYYVDYHGPEALPKALRQAWVLDGAWSVYRERRHGRSPAGIPSDRFVVFTQNHDQVGNRAAGERSSALMSHARLEVAAALLLTSPFVPLLFQGEEWAASTPFQYFTDHPDPELGQAVSKGRREEFVAFGWGPDEVPDPQDPATFERSRLDWTEIGREPHASMLAWYRDLLALRRRLPELTDPHLSTEVVRDGGLVTIDRGSVRVVANIGDHDRKVPVAPDAAVVAASVTLDDPAGGDVVLPVDSVVILHAPPR